MTTPQLQFVAEGHRYTLNGVQIPSVTQVIDALGMAPLYPPGPYRVRGTVVHEATGLFDRGIEFEAGDVILGYVESYRKALANFPFEWEAIEERLFDSSLLFAGTIDRRGRLRGKKVIADIKTGQTGRETALQTAGYAILAGDPLTYDRYKILLNGDGSCGKVERYPDPFDIQGFLAALNLYKWRNRK